MADRPRFGARIRTLRRRHGFSQKKLAARLGISPSYINLIEHNRRPVTASLLIKLAQCFELDLNTFAADDDRRLSRDLMEVLADALFEEHALSNVDVDEFVSTSPAVARAVRTLYQAYRESRESFAELAGDMTDGASTTLGRLPSEEVSDLIQENLNYFSGLEAAAEELWVEAGIPRDDLYGGLLRYVRDKLEVDVRIMRVQEAPGVMRHYDERKRLLSLSETLPPRSRNFHLAHQICLLTQADELEKIVGRSQLSTEDSRRLGWVALANYFAGAVLMPYEPFLEAAEQERYDIELMGHRFKTSLEQICHRLTTLRRPGKEGVPFHMVRVDLAGNISKKFSASGIGFARFGASCSRWNVFQSFLTPGRIRTQVSVMPDGKTFFCLASTIPKGRGGFQEPHTVQSIGLGCDISYATHLVYGDGLDLQSADAAIPIGVSCRLCSRTNCGQRAFPQINKPLRVDLNVRGISTFSPADV